jgi:hypothetical protein
MEEAKEIPKVESPPVAAVPAKEPDDGPRKRLHQLAEELARTPNRLLMREYLTLRRTLR